MAYIGREPQIGNFQVCDAISVVNGQAAYTMQVSSVNVSPETANHMIVSLNGIIQAPGSSYTVSGSTITFASNLVTGDVINFIHILGSVLDLGVPSNDTVGAAQIKDDLISGSTELASEPADTDEFLVSDAGVLKRIDYSLIKGGGITEADIFRFTTNKADSAQTPLSGSWERVDDASFSKIGTGVSESSGVFTFPSTGLYYVIFTSTGYAINNGCDLKILGTVNNGSAWDDLAIAKIGEDSGWYWNATINSYFNCTDTSNRKVRFDITLGANTDMIGSTTENSTYANFIRLGDSQ
tara:strand:+ start:1116 stop:2003 length:888 start_codon:yes stop_codon:yes gene_type:complete